LPKVTFILRDGARRETESPAGWTLLQIARHYGIDAIEGACDGALSCSTCHVVVAPEDYERLAAPSEDEEDMLDLASGLTPTSRLGCQVKVTEELDGLTVFLPRETFDIRKRR
jgi:2Fe-2S ferredoxin